MLSELRGINADWLRSVLPVLPGVVVGLGAFNTTWT
jgi:hypothetical protein